MEALDNLHGTLTSIKNVSNKIVQKTIQILTEISNDESDLVEDIAESLNQDLEDEEIVVEIQRYLDHLTADAETVYHEIGLFADAVIKGEGAIESIESDFFQQVWYGDMYDQDHVAGLRALLQDLQNQLRQLEEDHIINVISKRLSGTTQNNSESEDSSEVEEDETQSSDSD